MVLFSHPADFTPVCTTEFVAFSQRYPEIQKLGAELVGRNMDEIIRLLKAFQIAVKEKVALPADWPKNGLIGDHGIIPPPDSEDGAKKRLEEAKAGQVECYDGWFCHRKLKESA